MSVWVRFLVYFGLFPQRRDRPVRRATWREFTALGVPILVALVVENVVHLAWWLELVVIFAVAGPLAVLGQFVWPAPARRAR